METVSSKKNALYLVTTYYTKKRGQSDPSASNGQKWGSSPLVNNILPSDTERNSLVDEKFSLNEPVERVRDLVAVHNVWPDDLIRSLNMGGLAMPSIAVTKAEMGHEKYGSMLNDRAKMEGSITKDCM